MLILAFLKTLCQVRFYFCNIVCNVNDVAQILSNCNVHLFSDDILKSDGGQGHKMLQVVGIMNCELYKLKVIILSGIKVN